MKKDFDWYDFGPVLSRNAVYNMVCGGRGLGKTYGAKKYVINRWLRKGEQFVYLRRYATELKTRQTFFADISAEFPEWEFRVVGSDAQIRPMGSDDKSDWQTFGTFAALSKGQMMKSASYPRVTTIIYDEFILEKGCVQYLPDEASVFNNFYNTVDRFQDRVKVLMLANAVSIMNPYFTSYDVNPDSEWWCGADGFIVAHFPGAAKFKAQVSGTRFGRFIADTDYGDFAIGNTFSDNHKEMIGEKTPAAVFVFTMATEHGTFSLWCDAKDKYPYEWFVTEKAARDGKVVVMDAELMREGRMMLLPSDKMLQRIRTAFRHGHVFFSNPTLRNAFGRIFKR